MDETLDLYDKTAFITGGSGGLGKAIGKHLAARGAHVTIFSRRQGPLDEAQKEIRAVCASSTQDIQAVAVDLGNAEQVDATFCAQPRIPDFLYCCAGGNHAENGFFVDISAASVQSCMNNNYFSSAFAAKSMLNVWIADDKSAALSDRPRKRKIIFISSAAAFACLPGSAAYSPAKCAQRALADTLRIELIRECGPQSQYSVHCAFPADFVSPGFIEEQKTKTALTKRIQGLDNKSLAELEALFPSSETVAALIIAAVDRGDFIICEDSPSASALFTAMTGPSPKRGLGVADALLSVVVSWVVWPFLRRRWEDMVRSERRPPAMNAWAELKRSISWKLIGDRHI